MRRATPDPPASPTPVEPSQQSDPHEEHHLGTGLGRHLEIEGKDLEWIDAAAPVRVYEVHICDRLHAEHAVEEVEVDQNDTHKCRFKGRNVEGVDIGTLATAHHR